ncbi:MAG: hypothetical protein IKM79_07690 [Bacteroidales bacterium]|nr:hypothetical protein [Bacteroidales bacterium]
MKKKFVMEVPPIDFGDNVFLSIVAKVPDYIMADSLNRLYDLNLHRVVDLMPMGFPCYIDRSHDPLEYKLVHLTGVDNSFLLIVGGSGRAQEEVTRICNEFSAPDIQPDPYDLPAVERQEILHRFHESFTIVNEVRFTEKELALASSPGRRVLKGRAALADLYARILDAIDLSRC